MSEKADLDEEIRLMRIAVLNATFRRLHFMLMPERIALLVRSGWADEAIFKQIQNEQTTIVKVRLRFMRAFRAFRRISIAFGKRGR